MPLARHTMPGGGRSMAMLVVLVVLGVPVTRPRSGLPQNRTPTLLYRSDLKKDTVHLDVHTKRFWHITCTTRCGGKGSTRE